MVILKQHLNWLINSKADEYNEATVSKLHETFEVRGATGGTCKMKQENKQMRHINRQEQRLVLSSSQQYSNISNVKAAQVRTVM